MVSFDKLSLEKHFAITSSDKVSSIISPLTKTFNITHFRYLKLYNNGSRVLLSNYPDCTRFFYEEGHYKNMWFDGEFPEHLVEGWHYWDVMRIMNFGNELSSFEKEINKLLNLYHGMTFVKEGIGFHEIYTFDGNNRQIYQIDKKLLHHFILFFKEQAHKLIGKYEAEKIVIPSKKCLNKNHVYSEKNKVTDFLKNVRVKRYYLGGKYEGAYLTSKEAECIYWVLQGKSAEEIASIENNSIRTVERHLENVRQRLNCYKQTQLVKIVLESGIFDFRRK